MTDVQRQDAGHVGKWRTDHNGNLVAPVVMTRVGVYTYKHADGSTTRELRHPDDVFAPEAIESFKQVPITDEHPGDGAVTPENYRRYAVGNVGDSVSHDTRFVRADAYVRDADAIKIVRGDEQNPPKRHVSCGYTAKVVREDGEFMGERYDHRQTNIRGNHLAIVRNPRMGPEVRIVLDSGGAIQEDDYTPEDVQRWDMDQPRTLTGRKTPNGFEVVVPHTGADYTGWSVNDHEEAFYLLRSEHRRIRDLLGYVQESGVGAEEGLESKLTTALQQVQSAHDFHKAKSMALDSADPHADAEFGKEMQEKISKKIKKLKDEGKPQDQAVAIAHSMAREGKLDAEDGGAATTTDNQPAREQSMKTKIKAVTIGNGENQVKLDAMKVEVAEQDEQVVEQLIERHDTLVEALEEAVARADRAEGERDAAKAESVDPKRLDAMVREREEVMAVAQHVGLKRDDLRELDNAAIKRAVVDHERPNLLKQDSTDDYVDGCYDIIQKGIEAEHGALKDWAALGSAAAQAGVQGDPARKTDTGEGDGNRNDGDELTYAEQAQRNLEGLHNKSDEEIEEMQRKGLLA